MLLMARKKPDVPADAPAEKQPKRVPFDKGAAKPISMRLSREVVAALEDYLATFAYRPSQSAVIERALRTLLEVEGYVFEPPVE